MIDGRLYNCSNGYVDIVPMPRSTYRDVGSQHHMTDVDAVSVYAALLFDSREILL